LCESGYTKEPALIDKLLSMTLDESVRAQDVFYVFGTLAGNRHAMMRAWDFIKDNWDAIHKMFSSGLFFFIFLQTARVPAPPPFFCIKDNSDAIHKMFSSGLEGQFLLRRILTFVRVL